MKKKLIAVALLAAMAPLSVAYADNDAGCGAGTILWKGKRGIFWHLVATYTNGILGNGTFGITSGTLGCNGNTEITVDANLKQFASVNLDQLSAEMAAGEGEALTALAGLYKVEDADRAAFYTLTRENYGSIFSSTEVTAGEVVGSLNTLMAADARLSRYAI